MKKIAILAVLIGVFALNSDSAEFSACTFGGTGKAEISDMIRADDGSILLCGNISSEADMPAGVKAGMPAGGKIGEGSAFIANLAKDLSSFKFFSVFPEKSFEANSVMPSKNGEIYLAGVATDTAKLQSLPQFKSEIKEATWKGKACLAKLSPDGKNLEWIIKAAPNMDKITGMALDNNDNLLFTGDTSGKGAALYVVKLGKDGKTIDFAKGKFSKEKGYEKNWAIYLNESNEALRDKYYSFYRKGGNEGYDYDGETGKWGKVRFWEICPRVGGQICTLPSGDIIVSSGVYFMFKEGSNKGFPAFNLLLARFSNEGELRWATNLYQEGDSVHTPDQKPIDMAYDSKSDSIYLLASQHGSNIYRLKGELRGDTGNMKISWIGKIRANDGTLLEGWYFMNNRNPEDGAKGGYDENGLPRNAPHPKLAGNKLNKIAIGNDGNVYLAGSGSARMWTSHGAFQKWPAELSGGSLPCFVVLDPNLKKYLYATVFTGDQSSKNIGGAFSSLIIDGNRIILAGEVAESGFQKGPKMPWCGNDSTPNKKAAIVEIKAFDINP